MKIASSLRNPTLTNTYNLNNLYPQNIDQNSYNILKFLISHYKDFKDQQIFSKINNS